MSPDWLGSPQHLAAGALLGGVSVVFARRRIRPTWLLLSFALGIVALAELLVELIEYPLLYGADAHARAYYDTVADLAATIVGGLIGTVATFAVLARRQSDGWQ